MSTTRRIQSALISVYHKEGLAPIVKELQRIGATIYSTGGTQAAIEALGAEVVPVEQVTDYPSILGGRVKTLHPKVFGGILNRRDHEGDQAQMAQYDLPNIDLVVVDLYPFEATVAKPDCDLADAIENIDIGGPATAIAGTVALGNVAKWPLVAIIAPRLLELLGAGVVVYSVQRYGTSNADVKEDIGAVVDESKRALRNIFE